MREDQPFVMPFEAAVDIICATAAAVMEYTPRPAIPQRALMPRAAIAAGLHKFNREFSARMDLEAEQMSDDIAVQELFRIAVDVIMADVAATISAMFNGRTRP
jgi:hypothetical protein